jgi:NADH-quinone oxidoreductase subunit G
VDDLKEAMRSTKALYVVAADPAGDDPALAQTGDFLVVQDLFLTATAKLADVVLPVQAYTEREGSFTSGERRVQRYYPAVPERPGSKTDFAVAAEIGKLVGVELEGSAVAKIMMRIAESVPDYAGLSYQKLSEMTDQWPIIARGDLYYGGTGYENSQGLGVQLAPAAQRGEAVSLSWPQLTGVSTPENGLLVVPVTRLYDRGQTVVPSKLIHQRIPQPYVALHPGEAARLNLDQGDMAELILNGTASFVLVHLDEGLPTGVALVPRSLGIPISRPSYGELRAVEKVAA